MLSLIGRGPRWRICRRCWRACALYLGNNSGPKHIAAALGVPTVGIHSGVVDATEWGPIGPRAVAVRRKMVCSPCYLASPQDCHRELACLVGLEPATVYAVCARLLAARRRRAEPASRQTDAGVGRPKPDRLGGVRPRLVSRAPSRGGRRAVAIAARTRCCGTISISARHSATSPNALFDEAWYLEHHPGVAAAVEAGHFESGFDHYCLDGHASFSPHWLFDEALYRTRYHDLGDEVLAAGEFANGYDHFLKHGSREGRIGHVLFDPARYRAGLDADAARESDAIGAFRHFSRGSTRGGRDCRPRDYFDPDFYRARYPEIAAAIAAGEWRAALAALSAQPDADPLRSARLVLGGVLSGALLRTSPRPSRRDGCATATDIS